MPTKRRPVRARLSLIPFRYKRWLLCGKPGALVFLEAERVEALWSEYGEEITQRHIRRRPGSRPANFWRYNVSERWDSSRETQVQYLTRLNLLTAAERERLRIRPRLARSAGPVETSRRQEVLAPAPSNHPRHPLLPAAGWQFVLINDHVELVQVKPHAGAER
jgi:hypothetical protein